MRDDTATISALAPPQSEPANSDVMYPREPATTPEPVADHHALPPQSISVGRTPFTTNPQWAYQARCTQEVPGGIHGVTFYGSTPEDAVEQLVRSADELMVGAKIKWQDGSESTIDDRGMIVDTTEHPSATAYFRRLYFAYTSVPRVADSRVRDILETLVDAVADLTNKAATEIANGSN